MSTDPIEAFVPIGQPPGKQRMWNLRHKTVTDGARLNNVITRFRESSIKGPYMIDLSYNRLTINGVMQMLPLLDEYPQLKIDVGCNHFWFHELNPMLEKQGLTDLVEQKRIIMEHQTEELLTKAAEDIAAAAATLKKVAGYQRHCSLAIEEELRRTVELHLGPESNASTRWFYKPLPDDKVESLFDIDGLVDGQWENKDILVIISAKTYVEVHDVNDLKKQIAQISEYLKVLRDGGGWAIGNKNKKLKEQDRFFTGFLDYSIQGAIGGPAWSSNADDAAKDAGYWRIAINGHGYSVDM